MKCQLVSMYGDRLKWLFCFSNGLRRVGPRASGTRTTTTCVSFDQLVGAGEQRRWHGKAAKRRPTWRDDQQVGCTEPLSRQAWSPHEGASPDANTIWWLTSRPRRPPRVHHAARQPGGVAPHAQQSDRVRARRWREIRATDSPDAASKAGSDSEAC